MALSWYWHISKQVSASMLDLIHLPLDKMVAISQMIFSDAFLLMKILYFEFVPKRPIDNNSALVQAMAWCQTGDKPLPGAMLTQFTDASLQH